jgi:hypothetical protein
VVKPIINYVSIEVSRYPQYPRRWVKNHSQTVEDHPT